jgi:methionyl-tRNA formyltransferase
MMLYKPETLKREAFEQILESEAPDVIVVAAYGKLLPEYVLSYPKYGCINIHGSLLPEYRGAAPVNRAIIDGKTETGITTMMMEKGLDTGAMLLKERVAIEESDTASTLFDKLADVAVPLIVKTLELAENGALKPVEQDSSLATYAEKITDADMRIDWTGSAFEIVRRIHGLSEEPGAWTKNSASGKTIKLYRASAGPLVEGAECGQVVMARRRVQVACSDGSVFIELAKPEGGKLLTGADLANGRQVALGDILE